MCSQSDLWPPGVCRSLRWESTRCRSMWESSTRPSRSLRRSFSTVSSQTHTSSHHFRMRRNWFTSNLPDIYTSYTLWQRQVSLTPLLCPLVVGLWSSVAFQRAVITECLILRGDVCNYMFCFERIDRQDNVQNVQTVQTVQTVQNVPAAERKQTRWDILFWLTSSSNPLITIKSFFIRRQLNSKLKKWTF